MTFNVNHLNNSKIVFKKTRRLHVTLEVLLPVFPSQPHWFPILETITTAHVQRYRINSQEFSPTRSQVYMIQSKTTQAKNVSPCFNQMILLIPAGKFFHRFSTNTGSSEVRVSNRAGPLQLTWIQGLAREHFSGADGCQHRHHVGVIQ